MEDTATLRKGVGGGLESSLVRDTQRMAQEKAGGLSFADFEAEVKQVTNPEYAKMTTNEKVLNRLRKEAGESFVPEMISAESGRAPIKNYLSREEKLGAQQLSEVVSGLGSNAVQVLSENFDKIAPAQRAAAMEYLKAQAQSQALSKVQEISQNVKQEISAQEREIKAKLNLDDDEVLTFDINGQPLINGKTEAVRAADRARKKVEEEKAKYLEQVSRQMKDSTELHEKELAQIRSAYTVNGNITDAGLEKLAESDRKFSEAREESAEKTDETVEQIEENLDEYVSQQEARQAEVDLQIAKNNSIETQLKRKLAEQTATGAYNIQMEYAKLGQEIGFTSAIDEYEKRQAFAANDLNKTEKGQVIDGKIFNPSFERAQVFETAAQMFGANLSDTASYMRSRGFLESEITEQKEVYQKKVLGYSQEDIDKGKKQERVEEVIMKMYQGGEIGADDLDRVAVFEAEYPKEARRIELASTTDLTPTEIWAKVEREFFDAQPRAAKTTKTAKAATTKSTKAEKATPKESAAMSDYDEIFDAELPKMQARKQIDYASEDDAREEARKVLEDGIVDPADIVPWITDNFEVSNAAAERIKKRFVDYDPTLREYILDAESVKPAVEKSLPAMAEGAGVTTLEDMTPYEREKFLSGVDVDMLKQGVSQAKDIEPPAPVVQPEEEIVLPEPVMTEEEEEEESWWGKVKGIFKKKPKTGIAPAKPADTQSDLDFLNSILNAE
jgi:hypothetical protein